MKKYIYKYLIVLPLAISFISCDLDINDNPNFPANATSDMLIPSGITWSTARIGRDLQLVGGLWSQHYAQNNSSSQYGDWDVYNITNSSFDAVWSSIYSGALPDLNLAKTQAEANSQWGYWVQAQVMMAFDYHILVDFYETIPFSQALNEQYPLPKYDNGKDVNTGIIAMLDAAIAKKADATAGGQASLKEKDFVFSGDINKWIQFAKTLKLKILMRDFETNKTAIQSLLSEGDFLTADARMNGYIDKENNSNPLYESDRRKLNTKNNIKASATLITFLKVNEDPRLPDFFEKGIVGDDYVGLPQGGYSIGAAIIDPNTTSRANLAATDPVYFQSVAESNFLQAECYARLNDKTKAKAFYETGVKAAFTRWGHDATTFLATGGAYAFKDTNLDTMLECILTQKWVAAVRCQAWDSFFDINRTGYPKQGTEYTVLESDWATPNSNYIVGQLTPNVGSVLGGSFPKRLLIPKASSDYNINAPAVIPLKNKMWWHK